MIRRREEEVEEEVEDESKVNGVASPWIHASRRFVLASHGMETTRNKFYGLWGSVERVRNSRGRDYLTLAQLEPPGTVSKGSNTRYISRNGVLDSFRCSRLSV
jgi:hypothetical protein